MLYESHLSNHEIKKHAHRTRCISKINHSPYQSIYSRETFALNFFWERTNYSPFRRIVSKKDRFNDKSINQFGFNFLCLIILFISNDCVKSIINILIALNNNFWMKGFVARVYLKFPCIRIFRERQWSRVIRHVIIPALSISHGC